MRAVNSHGVSVWSAQLFLPMQVVLEGELAAGQQTDILPVSSGYSVFGSLGGTLTPDAFVIDGTTHEVQYLTHSSGGLWLGMDRELPSDFTLRVGDSTYRGSESMVAPAIDGVEGYWWPSASPDWLGDDPVPVDLIIHMGIALGDRQKAPVTGYFRNIPSEHGGTGDFSFRIHFSEGVTTTVEALRDHVLSVTSGAVSSVGAVGGEGRIWAVSVTPDSRGRTVTIGIEADLDCELADAICTGDGRRLFNRMELMVEARGYNAPTGAPIIGGTAEVGDTLTADTSGIADADGLTGATFRHQWVSYDGSVYTDIAGATGTSYTLVASDEGMAIRVRVNFTDDAGYEESLTSNLARSDRPYGLTAAVTDGAVVVTWRLPAGWPYGTYYRIMRNRPELGESEPLVYVRYTESGGPTYTDTGVEPGVLYVYRVKGVNFLGLTREASEPVEIRTPESTPVENSPATGAPTIGGTTQVGETLTVDTSGISDVDGMTNATFSYQWTAGASGIDGATDSAYTLTFSEVGQTVRVRASFTDDLDNEESLTSAATAGVESRPNSPATGDPTISGTAQVGETLTADVSDISDADGLSNSVFTYQWATSDATTDTDISGATSTAYLITSDDVGNTIRVRVSFTDDADNEEEATSAATAAVTAVPAQLTAKFLYTPASHDGENAITFELRFSEEFSLSYVTLRDHAFTATGGTVTNARRLAPPGNVRWEVAVLPDSDVDVTVVLPVTVDCEDGGAICTGDDRPLSSRLEITVPGPVG